LDIFSAAGMSSPLPTSMLNLFIRQAGPHSG
jgi:hypothetical protein